MYKRTIGQLESENLYNFLEISRSHLSSQPDRLSRVVLPHSRKGCFFVFDAHRRPLSKHEASAELPSLVGSAAGAIAIALLWLCPSGYQTGEHLLR